MRPEARRPSSGSTTTAPRAARVATCACVAGCAHISASMAGASTRGATLASTVVVMRALEERRLLDTRRGRIAMVQAGRLSRQELDESERILLESYERKEEAEQRPGFFERLSRRIAGSALGTLVASIITAASAAGWLPTPSIMVMTPRALTVE